MSDEYVIVSDDGSVTAVAEDIDIFEYVKTFGGAVVRRDEYIPPPYVPTYEELALIEDQWRDDQMRRIANQLLMIEDDDPDMEIGSKRNWMDYRINLRKWTDGGNEDFPNKDKRPTDPTYQKTNL